MQRAVEAKAEADASYAAMAAAAGACVRELGASTGGGRAPGGGAPGGG